MKISVLMSVYGRDDPAYLGEALHSLGAQSRRADEIVLVEDGPLTPELARTIETFRADLNIVSVRLAENWGLAHALNEGLKRCQNELVARMDADDVCLPNRFEVQAARFEADPTLDVLGSSAIEIDQGGKRGALRRVPKTHEGIVENLWLCPFIHPSIMMRAARLRALGGYNSALRRRQDYELWFRCHRMGLRLANVDRPLILYRFTAATLGKQSLRLAWEQSMIGLKGVRSIGMPVWQQVACFAPVMRSLLPAAGNYALYRWMHGVRTRHLGE